jgi:hypothetical protein
MKKWFSNLLNRKSLKSKDRVHRLFQEVRIAPLIFMTEIKRVILMIFLFMYYYNKY